MQSDAENKLEKLLTRAFDEPALRPPFYRVLLESTVYVISRTDLEGGGEHDLKRCESLDMLCVSAADDIGDPIFFHPWSGWRNFYRRMASGSASMRGICLNLPGEAPWCSIPDRVLSRVSIQRKSTPCSKPACTMTACLALRQAGAAAICDPGFGGPESQG
jgi:hypothetical protein